MNEEQAQNLAIDALGWLAKEPERLGHFLNASGAAPEMLRSRAKDPAFLGFVLDFLLLDDQMIINFGTDTGHPPQSVQVARQALTGDMPNWT